MEIILIRHAEPVVAQREDAPVDPELSGLGDWQAQCVGHWLACEPIDHIITSNKARAIHTATPLAERLGLEIEIVRDLDEIDREAKVYAPFHLLPSRFPDYWASVQKQDWKGIGWDPPDIFRARVVAAFEAIVARQPGHRVVVACHGGVISCITAHVLGIAQQWSLAVPPFASLTRVAAPAGSPAQILTLNEVAHFDTTRETVTGPEGPDGVEPAS